MIELQIFISATVIAILGFVPPGMMNMTIVKVALEQSKKKAMQFMLGTLTILFVQAFVAVSFSQFLTENPTIIQVLSYLAIVVFLLLSFMFYKNAQAKNVKQGLANGTFFSGIKMASINMLAIPFFLTNSIILKANKLFFNSLQNNFLFAFGAVFGCFLVFFSYMLLANFIQRRAVFVAKNINYILSILFLFLAILASYKTFFA